MMTNKKNITRAIIVSLIIVFQGVCYASVDELSSYISAVKARKAIPVTPIPKFHPIATFIYPEKEGRRSPFNHKNGAKTDDQLKPNSTRPRQFLEQFPLDTLKFVGILKRGTFIWGLISQPDGDISQVRVGSYMGKGFGKIIRINDTSLVLEEIVPIQGTWGKKVTTFNLDAGE